MERKIHESLKLVSMMAVNKWNSNFHLELSLQENRTTFSDAQILLNIFPGTMQKDVFLLPFNWIFQQLLVNGKQPLSTAKM